MSKLHSLLQEALGQYIDQALDRPKWLGSGTSLRVLLFLNSFLWLILYSETNFENPQPSKNIFPVSVLPSSLRIYKFH